MITPTVWSAMTTRATTGVVTGGMARVGDVIWFTNTTATTATDQWFDVSSTTGTVSMYYDSAWQSWVADIRADRTGVTEAAHGLFGNGVGGVIAEQRDAALAALQRREPRAQAYFDERASAQARAEELLLQCLTPAQRELYRRESVIQVVGGKTGLLYTIDARHFQRNIMRADGRNFCAHPPVRDMPLADIILIQKLAIQANEEHFLERANAA